MPNTGVNLIPEDIQAQRRAVAQEKRTLLVSGIVFAVSLLGLAGLLGSFLFFKTRLSSLEKETKSLEKRIETQRDTALLVADLHTRSRALLSLWSSRVSLTELVSAVAGLLPEKAQLTMLDVGEDEVVLEGYSLDYQSLATVINKGVSQIDATGKRFPFRQVSLRQATLDQESGRINFTIVLALREEKATDGGKK